MRRNLARGALVLLIGPCLLTASRAATFAVTRFDDPTGASCSVSDCSLRAAVNAANASAGADAIALKAGTYTVSIAGWGEDLGATGDLDVIDALTIQGAGQDATVIQSVAGDRVFDVVNTFNGTPGTLSLNDLTVTGGTAPANGYADLGNGGCIRAYRIALSNVTVSGCTAAFDGGAISGNAGDWQHVRIEKNKALGTGGAIVYVGPGVTIHDVAVSGNVSTMTSQLVAVPPNSPIPAVARSVGGLSLSIDPTAAIDDVALDANASHYCAGGRLLFQTGTTTLGTFTVTGNEAVVDGGGLCMTNAYSDITLELRDFLVTGNRAGRAAGGVDFGHFGNAGEPAHTYIVRFHDSAIEQNVAGSSGASGVQGGGVRFPQCGFCTGSASQSISFTDTRLIGNQAQYGGVGGAVYSELPVGLLRTHASGNSAANNGGALYLVKGAGNVSALTDSAFDHNSAPGVGGAIFVAGGATGAVGVSMQVRNCTFDANTAVWGGAVYTQDTRLKLTNATLRAAAQSPAGAQGTLLYSTASGSIAALNTILAGTCAGAPINAAVRDVESPGNTCNLGATSFPSVAPFALALGALQANGGATPTIMPGQGSFAIDHGDNSVCPGYDQRGLARPHSAGNPCDIGAVEANGLPVIKF